MTWIKCSERLPEEEGIYHIIHSHKNGIQVMGRAKFDGKKWDIHPEIELMFGSLTHWMPIAEGEE